MDDRALKLKWLALAHLYCLKQATKYPSQETRNSYNKKRAARFLEQIRNANLNNTPQSYNLKASIERLEKEVFE